jgi:nucleotide-binding universal stress UspA family protein
MTDSVVVGIDDSDGARAALTWAARYAATTASRLRVVHVYAFDIAWIDAYHEMIPQWEAHAREVAEETAARVVDEVLDDGSRPGSIEVAAIEGSAGRVLHDEARGAALLVVGRRGRGGFAGLLLGSVSQRLAQHSPCPIVIVPTQPEGPEATRA